MKSKIKAWILIIIFGAVTIADCTLTRIGTPNLKFEANPLVARLGMGWFGLITANVVVFILYSVLVYYAFVIYKKPLVYADSAKEYRKKIDKATGWKSTIAMLGYALSYSMIIGRLMPVYDWLRILNIITIKTPYALIKAAAPFGRPDLIVVIILAAISSAIWIIRHYKFTPHQTREES